MPNWRSDRSLFWHVLDRLGAKFLLLAWFPGGFRDGVLGRRAWCLSMWGRASFGIRVRREKPGKGEGERGQVFWESRGQASNTTSLCCFGHVTLFAWHSD